MKLVDNWQRTLLRAWSTHISALNGLVGLAAYYVPSLQEYVSPRTFILVMILMAVLTIVVRPIKQRSVSKGADHADQ